MWKLQRKKKPSTEKPPRMTTAPAIEVKQKRNKRRKNTQAVLKRKDTKIIETLNSVLVKDTE